MPRLFPLSFLFSTVTSFLRARVGAQGLVEYGMITAVVALVGMVGLNVLSAGQRSYLSGMSVSDPVPSAPGSLLHGTTVDASMCSPNPWIMGTPLTCSQVYVHDTYNPADRRPPQGTLTWQFAESPSLPIASCTLNTAVTTGDKNTCAVPPSFTPGSDPSWYNKTLHVQVVYTPTSNHVASPLVLTPLQVLPPLMFDAANTKCDQPSVAFGQPLICHAHLTYGGTTDAAGITMTWQADTSTGVTGDPFISCFTGGSQANYPSMIFASPSPDPTCNPSATHTCVTNASGRCDVVYRRMRDTTGNSITNVIGIHSLTPSVTLGGLTVSNPLTINVVNPAVAHPSFTILECPAESRTPTPPIPPWAPGDPPVLAEESPTGLPNVVNLYPMALSIDFPTGGGTLSSCVVTVWDADGSAASHCSLSLASLPPFLMCPNPLPAGGNPDSYDATPPIGTVTLDWPGSVPGDPRNTCTLSRLDSYHFDNGSYIPHYASRCALSIPLQITGSGSVTATFNPITNGGAPIHQASAFSVPATVH